MIWTTVISLFCFCWLYRASPSLAAKNIIDLILVLTIWWCPCVLFSCVVGRACLLWPVHSVGKTLLAFALLHFVFQGQIYLLLQATALSNSWTTALSNSVKLWPVLCRATQDRWVMVESSDKTWSTAEGNVKPLQHSSLENPMNSMKTQNDMMVKIKSSGW